MADEVTEPAEAAPASVPAGTLKRRGFKPAAEVIAEEAARKASATSPPPDEGTDHEMNAAIEADAGVNIEAGEGVSFEAAAAGGEVTSAAEPATLPQEAAETGEKIRLGGKEFATQAEAWAYAEQLEREKDVSDAFRQGVEAGNPPPQAAAPAPTPEPAFDVDILDPDYKIKLQAYLTKRDADLTAKVLQTVEQSKSTTDMWAGFYRDYPDLDKARDIVELTMKQNEKVLFPMEIPQALAFLAERTRAKLKPYLDAAMPKVVLPKVTTAASPGGAQGVTPKIQPSKPLSFTEQMKKNKRRTGAALLR